MLRYTLLVLLYITTCSIALKSSTDTAVNALSASSKLLPGMNGNLTPAQQIIYIYGPNQWKMQNSVNLVEKAGSDYLITPGMGHLAVINSNSEEKILLRVLEENKIDQAWLGVHDLYEEGDWNTIMDETLEATGYSKWTLSLPQFANQPDNFDGKQHCGVLREDGGMDDNYCSTAFAFFCEITF